MPSDRHPLPLLLALPILTALAVASVLFAAMPAGAAPGDPIVVNAGQNDFPLALPKPQTPNGAMGPAAEVWAVVHRDLSMTGYFDIIDPAAYIEQGKGVEPGTFDFGDWRIVKAAGLAKTRVTEENGQLVADVFIYDVGVGEKITGKRYTGGSAQARYLGHRIADAILLALTNQPGFFGTRVVAVGTQTGNKEIYAMDIDGEGVLAVTRNGSINLSPAWSPDGGAIAWTSYKRNNPDLYVKHLATGRTRTLANRPGFNSGASFSPDGRQIALAQSDEGDSDIYLVDAESGLRLKQVTKGGGIDVAPDFSPNGAQIAYSSERSGGSQIYVQDVATGAARRITFQGDWNFDPVWSRDGSQLAFVGRSGNFDIFVVDADGRNMRRITQDQGDNEDPSWSPDGRYLMFSSTRRGRSEIWISTSDGSHQVPVTTGGGWSQPAWSSR